MSHQVLVFAASIVINHPLLLAETAPGDELVVVPLKLWIGTHFLFTLYFSAEVLYKTMSCHPSTRTAATLLSVLIYTYYASKQAQIMCPQSLIIP